MSKTGIKVSIIGTDGKVMPSAIGVVVKALRSRNYKTLAEAYQREITEKKVDFLKVTKRYVDIV